MFVAASSLLLMRLRRAFLTPFAATLALVAAGWTVTVPRMSGMDMGPGTDPGSVWFFSATWAAMMTAMMLPSALPAVVALDRDASPRGRTTLSSLSFAAGYVAVWAVVGVVGFVAYRGVRASHFGLLAWDRGGAYATAATVVAAGVYELTPLKRASLRRCRAHADRETKAVGRGVRYGVNCVGCSAGFMLVLFALGVMSFTWMLVVGALVLVEKVPRFGPRLVVPVAVLLIALGTWIAIDASSVPGLTLPT